MLNTSISIENFTKKYGTRTILSIPHLLFHPGIYWIRGENGSGKTTFFKSLAGLLPFHGVIRFGDGIDLSEHPTDFRMRVNYSEAEPSYPGFLTAKDLFRFTARVRKASPHQQQQLIQSFCIGEYFESPCDTFSSGMCKKLSLAMAFLGDPKLLILDEPLITLDAQARKKLAGHMVSSVEKNTIILISSHQKLEDDAIRITAQYNLANGQLIRE